MRYACRSPPMANETHRNMERQLKHGVHGPKLQADSSANTLRSREGRALRLLQPGSDKQRSPPVRWQGLYRCAGFTQDMVGSRSFWGASGRAVVLKNRIGRGRRAHPKHCTAFPGILRGPASVSGYIFPWFNTVRREAIPAAGRSAGGQEVYTRHPHARDRARGSGLPHFTQDLCFR